MKITLPRDRNNWKATLSLAAYDLWLLAFPLQDYFLVRINQTSNFTFFVIPHTIVLFLTGRFADKIRFEQVFKAICNHNRNYDLSLPFLYRL
ncbi:hypothetical protein [Thermosulfidibacter takaii]|uniref:hypothetical protein n=1 Tax=Thermosulfidibacter takaii TaxID=412593 RepID=UPI00118741A5|nr:hypothetical protein [Thermosulfidibacter takaii]